MKKRLLSILLVSMMLLTSCVELPGIPSEQSGEMSVVSQNSQQPSEEYESAEKSENTEDLESAENTENSENIENSENTESTENSENTESVETSEISESSEEIESSETVQSNESFESTEQVSEESSETESSIPDSSYEIMDTPVIPVPDKVTAAEEDAFFNDSVFVGNSIMLGYQKFTNKQRAGSIPSFLGTAKFFVAGSFGVYHNNRTPASKENSSNPSYEGKKYSVEDAVGVMGVKTVYINFMGLNDLSLYYDSKNCARKCADDVIKLIKKINETYPDVNVVILSATYLTAARNNQPSLNNKNLSMLNNYLLDYCNENGLDFVDIASQLTEKGCLADKYASDGYCHIWTAGYKVWTAILRDYAVRKMNGTYTNPERMPLLGINV